MHRFLRTAATLLGAAVFAIAIVACEGPTADSDLAGSYKTEDTQGKPLEITLMADGKASGKREDESLTGTWKEEGGAAVITWGDGWTTKIAKKGDSYEKSAWEGAMEGEPTHTAAAEKVD
jgi:hypothetical protein